MMKIATFLTIASGLLFVAEYPTAKYLLVEIDDTDVDPDYLIPHYPDYPDYPAPYDEMGPIVHGAAINENTLKSKI